MDRNRTRWRCFDDAQCTLWDNRNWWWWCPLLNRENHLIVFVLPVAITTQGSSEHLLRFRHSFPAFRHCLTQRTGYCKSASRKLQIALTSTTVILWETRQSVTLRLKCDGTRLENRFRLSAKRPSPFKLAVASVQSTTGSRGVRISGNNGSNDGCTMFRGSVKGTGYPLN